MEKPSCTLALEFPILDSAPDRVHPEVVASCSLELQAPYSALKFLESTARSYRATAHSYRAQAISSIREVSFSWGAKLTAINCLPYLYLPFLVASSMSLESSCTCTALPCSTALVTALYSGVFSPSNPLAGLCTQYSLSWCEWAGESLQIHSVGVKS